MKTIVSTGQGRLHLIESAVAIKNTGTEVKVITGWVPSEKLSNNLINNIGRLVGRSNIAYGLRKRQPKELAPKEIKSCTFAEFFIQFLFILSNFKFLKRDTATVWGWKFYGWSSKRYIKNADIFHVRSGAGHGGAIKKAKKNGMIVIADHSAAHPNEIFSQLLKAYDKTNVPFNPETGLWKMALDDCMNSDYIQVNSDYVKNSFEKNGFNGKSIIVIPLGIRKDFANLKNSYKIAEPLKLLYTGSFGRWKGAHLIIEAIENLVSLNIKFEIEIIGSISDDLIIPEWFLKNENIKLHGHLTQDNLKCYLKNSDIYIFPSYCEGAAQSLKEAMAAGLPVIATEQSGAPIIHLTNGYIIPDNSSQSLTDAIIILSKDEGLRAKLGQNAASTIKTEHTWEKYGKNVAGLYDALLNKEKQTILNV